MIRIHALLLVGLLSATPALARPCGGVERWPVKVGSDADVSKVAVNSPTSISLWDLVFLPSPTVPHDDTIRLAEERAVYAVEARLKFKPEVGKTGDSDFHLVMTDDTLKFTQGSAVSPHSVVAEIVKPECVAGRKGNPATLSHFASQPTAVWQKFTARFPCTTHGWTDADAVPVRVTGGAFFEGPHGQTGRARNMIEIHPVLDIEFLDGPAPTAAGFLLNPGFEDGGTGWRSDANDVISTDALEEARTGAGRAWLGGHGEAATDSLWHEVTPPSQADSITLAVYLHTSTEEQSTEPYDKLTVRLRGANGQIIRTLKTFSNLQAANGYRLQTFDLTPHRGSGRPHRVQRPGRQRFRDVVRPGRFRHHREIGGACGGAQD